MASCFASAYCMSGFSGWNSEAGPLLLFLGLLTLINAPFDFLSLGLTRALLHAGLVRNEWWRPWLFSLADAVVAAVIIVVLAEAMVLGVQAFGDLAAANAGEDARILDVPDLLANLRATPGDTKYMWVWATLFSTMIPSMINLMIGWASLLRGWGATGLLARMPAEGIASASVRHSVALRLTLQVCGGVAGGVLAQSLAIYILLWNALPWFASDLMTISQNLANMDLPARLLGLPPHGG